MMDEVMIVCGMIVISVAVLYSIVQGLRRGPKLPAAVLLASVLVFLTVAVVHDFVVSAYVRDFHAVESLNSVLVRGLVVFVPLALGAYAHALRSRSGL